MKKVLLKILSSVFISIMLCSASPQLSDQQRLSMAVEYFQSGKYHEALLLFKKLDKSYRLNPRFVAYTGICLFYDQDYMSAAKTLDKIMIKLQAFAPHERSVYYYCAAESHYQLEHYTKAIELFENQLLLCYNNEKGDALSRIGLCYLKLGEIATAQEFLIQAVDYYRKYNDIDKLRKVEHDLP